MAVGPRRCGLVLGTTAALVLSAAGGAASAAAFSDGAATSGTSVSAAVLAPVTALGSSTTCAGGLLGLLGSNPVIDLTWIRSAQISGSSSPLRGHEIRVVVGSTTYEAVTLSPVTGNSDGTRVTGKRPLGGGTLTALATSTTHTLQVRSAWGEWRSVVASTPRNTPLLCL